MVKFYPQDWFDVFILLQCDLLSVLKTSTFVLLDPNPFIQVKSVSKRWYRWHLQFWCMQ